MKSWIKLLCILILSVHMAYGQDTAAIIRPAMFNPINEILISSLEGWQFRKKGGSTWEKLKPTELPARQADSENRLEGWLRFRFKLDKAFENIPLGVRYSGWAAAQLYVDGRLLQSFGVIGTEASSFKENNPSNKLPVPVNLKTGIEHEIIIHFADYISPFSSGELKSQTTGFYRFIRFTGPAYQARFAKHIREWPIYSTLWISVCTVLMLLFWLLAFLNQREKNLKLFAVCATFFVIMFCFKILSESKVISFKEYTVYISGFNLFTTISSCLTLIIVAKVFKDHVAGWLKATMAFLFVIGIINMFNRGGILPAIGTLVPIFIYIWYIISSRRILKGAQWAIVIGLMIFSFLTFLYIVMIIKYKTDFIPYNMLIVSGLILCFPLSLLVYVSLRFKEIVNEVRQNAQQVMQLSEEKREQALQQQKILEEEVARQTVEIRTSLENLKATQSQLIQSEKMASLGELTAGIAHEIQNPLNFVNNFSEVNNELIEEINNENDIGEIKLIANSIKQNSEKILFHGKRADAIVKGMLQHTRSSSGQKEPTDINALTDEYLRLAYHGLRAKDKTFNATLKTDYDQTIGNIDIIPQDIGRVILNLIANAFYAVAEMKKQQPDDYEPTVTVTTKKLSDKALVSVKDNGNGIPKNILDKIFQPFFTTKPAGQGTGLGLSLSYDIVRGHGGQLKIETKIGEGSEFIIQLPVN